MSRWVLPTSAVIGGVEYKLHADFRDVLNIISHLQNQEDTPQERIYIALALFYEGFDAMPRSDHQEAADYLMQFINCGEPEADTGPHPKRIDWEQDAGHIVSGVNKVAGAEIRSLPFLHWWTFIAFFSAVGEGTLATVVSIRDKRRKGKKLDDWERDFYQENRDMVDFRHKYTAEELEERERLRKLIDG